MMPLPTADRAHVVVGDDGPLDRQAGALRQADVRPDPGRDDQHVAVQRGPVGEGDARQSAVVADDHLGGALARVHADSEVLHGFSQDRPGGIVELGRSSARVRRAPRRPSGPGSAARGRPPVLSSPPPITTALVRLAASAIMVAVSSSVRNPEHAVGQVLSSAHSPVIGEERALPVARISLS